LDDEARLIRACRLALGRGPTDGERRVLLEFLSGMKESSAEGRRAAWADIVHTLFASNDFRHVN
jgi:hypothetical protein